MSDAAYFSPFSEPPARMDARSVREGFKECRGRKREREGERGNAKQSHRLNLLFMMAIKSRYSFLDFVQIARSIAKSISLRDVDSNEIIRGEKS